MRRFKSRRTATFDSDNRSRDTGSNERSFEPLPAIAGISDAQFEQRLEEIKEKGQHPTSSDLLSFAKVPCDRERERQDRRERAAEAAREVEPDDRIRVPPR